MECDLEHWKTHCGKVHNARLENTFKHLTNVIKSTKTVVVHGLGSQYRLEVRVNHFTNHYSGYCLCGQWIEFEDACDIDKMLNDFVNDWFIGDLCRVQFVPYPIRQLASDNLSELELKLTLKGE